MRRSLGLVGVLVTFLFVTNPRVSSAPPQTYAISPFGHVFIVMEENHSYSSVIGNSSMPYLNGLANQYGLATNYFANTHPSIGNYFMLTTGQIITNDDAFAGTVNDDNIVRQVVAAGKTWKSYAESLPSVGYTGGDVYPYSRHHNPFTYFSDVLNSPPQLNNLVPFSQFPIDLANNALPQYSFIVPNLLHDAHDGTLAAADSWLQTNIGPLIASPLFQQDGLLVIVFDESFDTDTQNGGGQVAMVVVSPKAKSAYRSTTLYQHQSTLRLMAQGIGLSSFPSAAATALETCEFFLSTGSGPLICNVAATNIGLSSGSITWTTNVPATTQVEYGTSTTYGQMTVLDSTLVTSHSQSLAGLSAGTLYHYRVHSLNSSGVETVSGDFTFTTGVIPQTGWSLRFVDSQELVGENDAAVNSFDGNPGTLWHTQWFSASPPPPHEIQINLGATYNLTGFLYLPRQDGCSNGWIRQYEFYVSQDGVNWGTAVASGIFDYGSATTGCPGASVPPAIRVTFTSLPGRYVRLRALSEINGNPWTSMAELNLLSGPTPPVTVSSLALNPASVVGGNTSQGTVTLSGAAPSGGAVVTLSSSNTAVATVPASVTVSAGATSATFTASTSAVATSTPVTITASYNATSKTATLTVSPPAVSALALSPTSVTGGTSSQGTVTLSGPAPSGGAVVTLTSSNTAVATVPASVTVAAGATSATFTVTTSTVTAVSSSTISASYRGSTASATLTVQPSIIVIPQTGWSLQFVDSQETDPAAGENDAAVNAFDGNPNTLWHTQWFRASPPPPHEIQINLGATYNLTGFLYLPRQDGCSNGWIRQYEFYVSQDGVHWGTPVASGIFDYGSAVTGCLGASVPPAIRITFAPTPGHYVRLRALSEISGNPWTSMAELNLLAIR